MTREARFLPQWSGRTPVYTCRVCGKRTRETGDCESSVEMCRKCYFIARPGRAAKMTAPTLSLIPGEPITGRAPWLRIVRESGPVPGYERAAAPRRLGGPRAVYDALRYLDSSEVEHFIVLCLDAQHNLLARVEVSRGTLNSTLVHPREVFRVAIAVGASSVVLAHNHPSGDPTPSADDRAVTSQLVAAGRLLDIPVQDHVIVGRDTFTSFAERGLL